MHACAAWLGCLRLGGQLKATGKIKTYQRALQQKELGFNPSSSFYAWQFPATRPLVDYHRIRSSGLCCKRGEIPFLAMELEDISSRLI